MTLLHELGHLFCGHLGPFTDNNLSVDEFGWPDRSDLPHAAKEIEAELVAWWLANREGLTTGSPHYLRPYLERAGAAVAEVDLERVTRAWHGSGVTSEGSPEETAHPDRNGKPRTTVIDLLGYPAYFELNRTRPASVRKDMHTGRVFCFQALDVKH